MPLPSYGVLVATPIAKLDSPDAIAKVRNGKPHFQILVSANSTQYRIAVNVKSDQAPPNLRVYLTDNFSHPILDSLQALPMGFTALSSDSTPTGLDFQRMNLFPIDRMRVLAATGSPSGDDMNDIFDQHVLQAIKTPGAKVFAFGSAWGPEENKPDEYFEFTPGNGIHDIHMNQGNTGHFEKDNGTYQDGALIIYYPDEDRWSALFSMFQSQVLPTDDTGDSEQ